MWATCVSGRVGYLLLQPCGLPVAQPCGLPGSGYVGCLWLRPCGLPVAQDICAACGYGHVGYLSPQPCGLPVALAVWATCGSGHVSYSCTCGSGHVDYLWLWPCGLCVALALWATCGSSHVGCLWPDFSFFTHLSPFPLTACPGHDDAQEARSSRFRESSVTPDRHPFADWPQCGLVDSNVHSAHLWRTDRWAVWDTSQ